MSSKGLGGGVTRKVASVVTTVLLGFGMVIATASTASAAQSQITSTLKCTTTNNWVHIKSVADRYDTITHTPSSGKTTLWLPYGSHSNVTHLSNTQASTTTWTRVNAYAIASHSQLCTTPSTY
jgi:hypothetical protein